MTDSSPFTATTHRRPGSSPGSTEKPDHPLKAERVQLVVVVLPAANSPYDFARESPAERDARLEAGWRKRTVDDPWRPRSARRAA